jgi:hypothetical protein
VINKEGTERLNPSYVESDIPGLSLAVAENGRSQVIELYWAPVGIKYGLFPE